MPEGDDQAGAIPEIDPRILVCFESLIRAENRLFEASRQGIVLASAVIATAAFWTSVIGIKATVWAIVFLGLSILAGIATHVVHGVRSFEGGYRYLKALQTGQLISSNRRWDWPTWIVGGVQLTLFFIAACILLIAYAICPSG